MFFLDLSFTNICPSTRFVNSKSADYLTEEESSVNIEYCHFGEVGDQNKGNRQKIQKRRKLF